MPSAPDTGGTPRITAQKVEAVPQGLLTTDTGTYPGPLPSMEDTSFGEIPHPADGAKLPIQPLGLISRGQLSPHGLTPQYLPEEGIPTSQVDSNNTLATNEGAVIDGQSPTLLCSTSARTCLGALQPTSQALPSVAPTVRFPDPAFAHLVSLAEGMCNHSLPLASPERLPVRSSSPAQSFTRAMPRHKGYPRNPSSPYPRHHMALPLIGGGGAAFPSNQAMRGHLSNFHLFNQ